MRFVLTAEKSGISLGEYDKAAPCVRLEQGKPRAGMKRPLDLAPGEQTVVDYPLDGFAKGDPRSIACAVKRVDEEAPAQPGPSPIPPRPRVVEVEQPARNIVDTIETVTIPGRIPKPPAKVDAPPASAARRRVARKTP